MDMQRCHSPLGDNACIRWKLFLMTTVAMYEVNVLAGACVPLPSESVTITMPKKKKKIPDKLQAWIDARKAYHLSHSQVQMARDLCMNPKGFRKLANHKQEKWKLPLPLFIEECYFKRFGRTQPEQVTPIEQIAKAINRKKEEKKLKREQERTLKPALESPAKPTDGDDNQGQARSD